MVTSDSDIIGYLKKIYESEINEGISFTRKSIRYEEIDSLLEEAIKNKVFPKIYEVVSKVHSVKTKYNDFYDKYKKFRAENFRVMRKLENYQHKYIVLKGAGIEQYYPSHCERYFHDLDICVYSQEDFFEINNFLLGSGLEQNSTMLLFLNSKEGKIQGSTRLDPIKEMDYFEGIEIQIGAFPMTHRTFLPWEVFMKNAVIQTTINGTTIPTPDRQGNFLIYLAEIISRNKLTLRDLFDVSYVLEGSTEKDLDINFIVHAITRYNLFYSINLLKIAYESVEGFECPTALKIIIEEINRRSSPLLKKDKHVKNYLKENSDNFWKSYLLYKVREYSNVINDKNKFLWLLRRSDDLFSPKHFFLQDTFVYFMKINDFQTDYKWIKINKFTINLTPIGSYLVCMHALHSDEELDEAHDLLQEIILKERPLDDYIVL